MISAKASEILNKKYIENLQSEEQKKNRMRNANRTVEDEKDRRCPLCGAPYHYPCPWR